LYVNLLLIAIGGALGSMARFLLSSFVLRATASLFPWGTFAVNLIGCIVFGIIIGLSEHRLSLTPELRAFLLIGILGGFTTFSSFAFESFALLRDGQMAAAAFNVFGQVITGLAGVWAGVMLAR
jgi:CrcB protein